jgi:hypothetical protein
MYLLRLIFLLSSLQRFFPDFFPSCYTEKRLNLIRLYSEIERKNDDDILGTEPDFDFVTSFMDKFKLPDTLLASVNSLVAAQMQTAQVTGTVEGNEQQNK